MLASLLYIISHMIRPTDRRLVATNHLLQDSYFLQCCN